MANPEHVAILKQGVKAWNTWRNAQPGIQPDLQEANFPSMDLNGVNLSKAVLRRTSFHKAILYEADLHEADLQGAVFLSANLTGANLAATNLTEANLERSSLIGTRLREADLTKANCIMANFHRAHIQEANLTEIRLDFATLHQTYLQNASLCRAVLFQTVLADVDLTKAIGLEECIHHGPSFIDFYTLRYGRLPITFLRGCGLPDNVIDYLPSLLNEPLAFYSCFISHSSLDQAFAERLHTDLQDKGVRCWFAPHDMKIGDKFRSRIDQSIHLHDRLLLILSENSINSSWVEKEVETAFEKEVKEQRLVLFPIRVDEAVMESTIGWAADIRRQRHIGDFTRWKDRDTYQKAFTRLLRDLKNEDEKGQKKATE